MKAVDIIYRVCRMLGMDDYCLELDKYYLAKSTGGSYNIPDGIKTKLNEFILPINDATEHIANYNEVFLTTETLESDADGLIDYSSFKHTPIRVCGVYNENGVEDKIFLPLPFALKVWDACAKKKICYSFMPDRIKDIEEDVKIPRTYAETATVYLVCYYVLLERNLYDECRVWLDKFEKYVTQKAVDRKSRYLKSSPLI